MLQKKWNSPQILPLEYDIGKIQNHLKCLEEVHKKALIDYLSPKAWSKLSQVTLAQLILFNLRREGEDSRMVITTL